jgi:hypothetical protein
MGSAEVPGAIQYSAFFEAFLALVTLLQIRYCRFNSDQASFQFATSAVLVATSQH